MNPKPFASLNHFTFPVVRIWYFLYYWSEVPCCGTDPTTVCSRSRRSQPTPENQRDLATPQVPCTANLALCPRKRCASGLNLMGQAPGVNQFVAAATPSSAGTA